MTARGACFVSFLILSFRVLYYLITESHGYNALVPKYILIIIGRNREGWTLALWVSIRKTFSLQASRKGEKKTIQLITKAIHKTLGWGFKGGIKGIQFCFFFCDEGIFNFKRHWIKRNRIIIDWLIESVSNQIGSVKNRWVFERLKA